MGDQMRISPDSKNEGLGKLKEKAETGENLDQSVDELAADSNSIMNSYEARLDELPDEFKDSLHNNIVQYFMTSADRYDQDAEQGMDKMEFGKYAGAMLGKLRQILEQHAPSKEALAAREQQQEAAESAREAVESLDDLELSDVEFDKENLKKGPEGVAVELQKLNQRSETLRTQMAETAQAIGSFQESYATYEEGLSSFKSWFTGRLHKMAIGGLVGYKDPEAEGLENTLNDLKSNLDSRLPELQAEEGLVNAYGVKMNHAGEHLRKNIRGEKEEAVGKVEEQDKSINTRKAKDMDQYELIRSQEQDLKSQRTELEMHLQGLSVQSDAAVDAEQQVFVQEQQPGDFEDMIGGTLEVLNGTLNNQDLPEERRSELEAQRDELLTKLELVKGGQAGAMDAKQTVEQASAELSANISQAEGGLLNVETYLNGFISPSLEALDVSIQSLELARKGNGNQMEQLEVGFDEKLAAVDQMDALVADNVLQNNLSNSQMLGSLSSQQGSLAMMDIHKPNLWTIAGGFGLNKLGHGLSWVSHNVFDKVADLNHQVLKHIPVVGVVLGAAVELGTGIPSAAFDLTGELICGINGIIERPKMAWDGIRTLLGRDPVTGEWGNGELAKDSWKSIGKAMIGYDEFAEGNWGKGVGTIVFNVFLTLGTLGSNTLVKSAGEAGTYAMEQAVARGASLSAARMQAVKAASFYVAVETPIGFAKTTYGLLKSPFTIGKGLLRSARRMKLDKAGRLGETISGLTDDMARLESSVNGMKIGGKPVYEIPGLNNMSFRDIGKLNADDLARMGITDARSIRDFVRLRKAAAQYIHAKDAATAMTNTLNHMEYLARFADDLPELLNINPGNLDELNSFIKSFNKKHPQGFPGHKMRPLSQIGEGRVAFDSAGKLKFFPDEAAYQSELVRGVYGAEGGQAGRVVAEIGPQGVVWSGAKPLGARIGKPRRTTVRKTPEAMQQEARAMAKTRRAGREAATEARVAGAVDHLDDGAALVPNEIDDVIGLQGSQVDDFIDAFNANHPQGFPEFVGEEIAVLGKQRVAFGANGRLKVFPDQGAYVDELVHGRVSSPVKASKGTVADFVDDVRWGVGESAGTSGPRLVSTAGRKVKPSARLARVQRIDGATPGTFPGGRAPVKPAAKGHTVVDTPDSLRANAAEMAATRQAGREAAAAIDPSAMRQASSTPMTPQAKAAARSEWAKKGSAGTLDSSGRLVSRTADGPLGVAPSGPVETTLDGMRSLLKKKSGAAGDRVILDSVFNGENIKAVATVDAEIVVPYVLADGSVTTAKGFSLTASGGEKIKVVLMQEPGGAVTLWEAKGATIIDGQTAFYLEDIATVNGVQVGKLAA